MKKIFTLAVIAVASAFGMSAGDFYSGGSFGFLHEQSSEVATNRFTLIPEVGYNINQRWAVGTTIGYEYTHFNGWKIDTHMFEFNPYARYTAFTTGNGLISLFTDLGVGFGAGCAKWDGHDSDTLFIWQIGARPGLAINLTNNFSLVTHVGFLGYEGANRTALDFGYKRRGGITYDYNDITFGFYCKF